jgi:hypothetical protein
MADSVRTTPFPVHAEPGDGAVEARLQEDQPVDSDTHKITVGIVSEWVPRVQAYLNGSGPYTLLLETGHIGFSISPAVAAELGLPTEPSVPRVLSSFGIGGYRREWLPVGLYDTEFASEVLGTRVDGYFGNLLVYALGLSMTIDYPGRLLTLEPSLPGGQSLRLGGGPVPTMLRGVRLGFRRRSELQATWLQVEISNGYTIVPVHVDGDGSHDFVLDTGAQACIVSPELAATLGLPQGDPTTARCGALGDHKVRPSRVSEFRAGDIVCEHLPVAVMACDDISGLAGRPLAGYVGHSFLEQFAMTIDYRQCKAA